MYEYIFEEEEEEKKKHKTISNQSVLNFIGLVCLYITIKIVQSINKQEK